MSASEQFESYVMAQEQRTHDITCACAKCNTPEPFKYFTSGAIRADTIQTEPMMSVHPTMHPPKPRTFIWARQSSVPLAPFDKMDGPATYDNGGRYVVFETVLDLEYTIVDTEDGNRIVKAVPLSLEDAKSYCDTWNAPAFAPDYSIIAQLPKQYDYPIWDWAERKIISGLMLVISFVLVGFLNAVFDWGLF